HQWSKSWSIFPQLNLLFGLSVVYIHVLASVEDILGSNHCILLDRFALEGSNNVWLKMTYFLHECTNIVINIFSHTKFVIFGVLIFESKKYIKDRTKIRSTLLDEFVS
ncbi:hypothetical protein ACJX0J_013101, partial [Zea mays]